MPRKIVNILLLLTAFLVLGFTGMAYADPDPCDKAARLESFEKGLIAADQEQWEEAAAHFLACGKDGIRLLDSPLSNKRLYEPDTLLKLALTFDNAEGGNLFAANYYQAYLAMEPGAPNAAAIRQRINEILDASEALARKLTINAEEALRGQAKSYDEKDSYFYGRKIGDFIHSQTLHRAASSLDSIATAKVYQGDWNRDTWWDLARTWKLDQDFYVRRLALVIALTRTGDKKGMAWLNARLSPDMRQETNDFISQNISWIMGPSIPDKPPSEPEKAVAYQYIRNNASLNEYFDDYDTKRFVDSPSYWERNKTRKISLPDKFAEAAEVLSERVYLIRRLEPYRQALLENARGEQ